MAELSPSTLGRCALPESTSTGNRKKLSDERRRSQRSPQIKTAIAGSTSSLQCQPPIGTAIMSIRENRALAAATGGTLSHGAPGRRHAKRASSVAGIPAREFDPDTIHLQNSDEEEVGMQSDSEGSESSAAEGQLSGQSPQIRLLPGPSELCREQHTIVGPMTDKDAEGDDPADNVPESDGVLGEVAEGIAARYLELTRILRAQLQEQKEVQHKLEVGLDRLKKTVKEAEELAKAERSGDTAFIL